MIQIVRELKGYELIFTAMTMLMGEEGVDFSYYGCGDFYTPDWWTLRLYTRRN